MNEQSTPQSTSSPTTTEPAVTPEPTPPPLDEPMFPLPKMDLDLREGLDGLDGD